MSDITKVTGQECLNYINKDIAFATRTTSGVNGVRHPLVIYTEQDSSFNTYRSGTITPQSSYIRLKSQNNRIVGYVKKKCDDGGYYIVLMGNTTIPVANNVVYGNRRHIEVTTQQEYEQDISPVSPTRTDWFPLTDKWEGDIYPKRRFWYEDMYSGFSFTIYDDGSSVSFDNTLDMGVFDEENAQTMVDGNNGFNLKIGGGQTASLNLTNDTNSIEFGGFVSYNNANIDLNMCDNPFYGMFGNVYNFGREYSRLFKEFFSQKLDVNTFQDLLYWNYRPCESNNGVCVPFNLILTENLDFAKAYVNNGILPQDAFLFPLDWDNLPNYMMPDDDGDDGEDDNTPDDNTRDVTPNPPVIPSFTPSMLTNNNYYWLTAPQLAGFISWYWNDVGNIQDIDDLLAKIEGLYNNLSQAILNIRFMPVEVSWIGGTGAQSNIKIAQIEKDGLVDTLSKTGKPTVETIGHIHIPNKYNSFVDLSPYSQLSVYLPYHGFLDLDMNIFSGHDLYVKAIYDYMSGTIQYLLYYDNQFLVNTIICKMAMDIPISLQTKNDRDSAVFQNVSNVVGGLMGAGLSLGTGNPMGLLVGANALNSGVASAPLNVKGNVGEQGAFYAPPQCSIILRRPTISKPSADIWKSKVGQICGKSYTLANLTGYTTVYNPQITFSGNKNADGVTMKPLQSEIEEIYSALEKGVIL